MVDKLSMIADVSVPGVGAELNEVGTSVVVPVGPMYIAVVLSVLVVQSLIGTVERLVVCSVVKPLVAQSVEVALVNHSVARLNNVVASVTDVVGGVLKITVVAADQPEVVADSMVVPKGGGATVVVKTCSRFLAG